MPIDNPQIKSRRMSCQKLFTKHLLCDLKEIDEDIYYLDKQIESVWIQGFVKSIQIELREVLLEDRSGQILVAIQSNYVNLSNFNVGDYVMAIGEVVIADHEITEEKIVFVEAKQLIKLESVDQLETLWQLEVNDNMK